MRFGIGRKSSGNGQTVRMRTRPAPLPGATAKCGIERFLIHLKYE